jgi:kinetochore protein Spc7/SPC105
VVHEIENDTFEENPPLFKEYIAATPEVKVLMDNQFKNVKTNARLLSKGMWYEWRMKLLDGLKEGLDNNSNGMSADREVLQRQQELLDSVLPTLLQRHAQLEAENAELESVEQELANCDQEELSETRQRLISLEADVEAKRRLLQELNDQIQEKDKGIEMATAKKLAYQEDIKEAEKIREECRGWSASEVAALKCEDSNHSIYGKILIYSTAKVDSLEQEYGWTITGVSGTTTSMTYRGEIELVFDASSFKSRKQGLRTQDSRVDLWYIAANRELNPQPLTPEKDFFLQNIRDHIRGLPQAETYIKDLLNSVSEAWKRASAAVNDIRCLKLNYPSETTKTSDSSIVVRSSLLLVPLATKVELSFELSTYSTESGIDVHIAPAARVIYGERFNEPKMVEYLVSRIGTSINAEDAHGSGTWGGVATELAEKLLARGKK